MREWSGKLANSRKSILFAVIGLILVVALAGYLFYPTSSSTSTSITTGQSSTVGMNVSYCYSSDSPTGDCVGLTSSQPNVLPENASSGFMSITIFTKQFDVSGYLTYQCASNTTSCVQNDLAFNMNISSYQACVQSNSGISNGVACYFRSDYFSIPSLSRTNLYARASLSVFPSACGTVAQCNSTVFVQTFLIATN